MKFWVSYAFKRGCTEVLLVYPNLDDDLNVPDRFEIVSGFDAKERVNVTAIEVPFWGNVFDNNRLDNKMFEELEKALKH
jgi:5-methylcytosine-specific restriction enzyme subunit McrC